MNSALSSNEARIKALENELQQQKGMLWLVGEIIKAANNISSFEELMKVLTDMLMGITGVNTCFLWVKDRKEMVRVYCRSTEFNNAFKELRQECIPMAIKNLETTYEYKKEEISLPLKDGMSIPASRLVVPLRSIEHNDTIIGGLVLEHTLPNFFTTGNIIFFEMLGVFISSNTTNSRLFENVTEENETDPLTQTFNRRYLGKRVDGLTETHEVMSVAVLDIDNFKLVNDFRGHTEGDEVLKEIASAAQTYLTPYKGEVIRYGGDEFVLLIPHEMKETLILLEKFQQVIKDLPSIVDTKLPVSLTIGLGEYPTMNRDVTKLVKAADSALIRGKSTGKNKVVLVTAEDFSNL